jgi:hypothetical protein
LEEQEVRAGREEENKKRNTNRAEQEKHQKAPQEEVANYTMADLFKDQNISSNS